ncbi:MAG TPA: glycosyltransferase [Pyrinomonadaceae bacterium]|nr:glycosyltransferase [Pyrinomonadaceae bacterium]
MKTISIGIYVDGQLERLRWTLGSLHANTPQDVELLLLLDGVALNETAARTLPAWNRVKLSGTSEAHGAAACFNRLTAQTETDVLVLLESGVQVASDWLDRLLDALASDPLNGLAGPSTNNSWNEQCAFPHCSGNTAQILATANEAVRRFGGEVRTLEPLYSLGDFCYVVRREVIEAVGPADERYSLGPCWEMDYNIRAARAGWRGVWACGAFVYRPAFSARRRFEEGRRFETSKKLYQDKFCGARLRGLKTDYREHCRGDVCPNFAPANLIEIKRTSSVAATPAPTQIVEVSEPLVTCIMPTYNRRSFIPQAIRCFLRQDYPRLELLVVDDGTEPVEDLVPVSDRVRYVRFDQKLTIGAKRNLACEKARGEIIVHWDDDDWYPSWRVRAQVRAMLEGGADMCGSSRVAYFDPSRDQAWEYRYPAAKGPWVAGNTLAYRKSFWARHKFPDIQVGEDSRFVWSSKGRSVADLADPGLCVATVHSNNTSRKNVNAVYWHAQPRDYIDSLIGDDIYFYRTVETSWPLVSCIMPTYERRRYIPQALQSFSQQDYPNRELIIVDDGKDAIGDLVEQLPNVRYLHVPRTLIGTKRNLACKHAAGEIIAHWDDDDWYSPDRLRYQVMPIIAGKADLTGLENAFVLELPNGEFWTTEPALHRRLFVGNVHGGTLVYRKDLWTQGVRYPEVNLAEDAGLLVRATQRGKRLVRLSNPGVFIYVRHGRNAWRQFAPGTFIDPKGWQRIAAPLNFPADVLEFYKQASAQNRAR